MEITGGFYERYRRGDGSRRRSAAVAGDAVAETV